MKTILAPTDFSPAAKNACDYAASLCKLLKSKLILFNSYMLPVPVFEIPFVMVTADELEKNNEESIKKETERLFSTYGIEVEWLVRIGIPDEEIKDLEDEKDIDLVVMGLKGSGNHSKLIGSTTNAVIRKLRKPALVVPETAKFSHIRSVTYATDFDAEIKLACFAPLLELLRKLGAHLHVLNVRKETKGMNAEENAGKSRLEAIWGDIPHSYHFIEDKNMERAIQHFADEQSIDMLVMVVHHHNFFERIFGNHLTKDMTAKTHIPLLVLQDKE